MSVGCAGLELGTRACSFNEISLRIFLLENIHITFDENANILWSLYLETLTRELLELIDSLSFDCAHQTQSAKKQTKSDRKTSFHVI